MLSGRCKTQRVVGSHCLGAVAGTARKAFGGIQGIQGKERGEKKCGPLVWALNLHVRDLIFKAFFPPWSLWDLTGALRFSVLHFPVSTKRGVCTTVTHMGMLWRQFVRFEVWVFQLLLLSGLSVCKKRKLYIRTIVRTDADPCLEILVLWKPQYFPGAVQMYIQQAWQHFEVHVFMLFPCQK